MQKILASIAALGHWAYLAEGLIIFAEDALFFGFVFPGETVLALCGFLAHQRVLNPFVVAGVAAVAAILGDQAGFEVGRYFGPSLKESRPGRMVGETSWSTAESMLAERGGFAVFLGRWTAFLRALVPTTSGLLHMHWLTFTRWNALGGVLWSIAWTLLGYGAGASWQAAATRFGEISAAVGLVVIIGVIVAFVRRRRAKER